MGSILRVANNAYSCTPPLKFTRDDWVYGICRRPPEQVDKCLERLIDSGYDVLKPLQAPTRDGPILPW